MTAGGYGALSVCYDSFFSVAYKHRTAARYLRALSGLKSGARVLDVGCGTGLVTLALLKAGYGVTGLDICPQMLEVARKKALKAHAARCELVCADITKQLPGGLFEAAVSSLDVLNHITDAAALQAALGNIGLSLCPGAPFVFDVNSLMKFERQYSSNSYRYSSRDGACVWDNDYDSGTQLCRFTVTVSAGGRESTDVFYERYYPPEYLASLLADAGFEAPVIKRVDGGGRLVYYTNKKTGLSAD